MENLIFMKNSELRMFKALRKNNCREKITKQRTKLRRVR